MARRYAPLSDLLGSAIARPKSISGGLLLLLVLCFSAVAQEVPREEPPAADFASEVDHPNPFDQGPVMFQSRRLRCLTGEVATLVLRGEPGGNFSIEALATPLPGKTTDKADVPLFVEIDGSSFMDMNRSRQTRVEIYAYALSGTTVVDYLADIFVVDTGQLGEVVWQSGLKFYGHLRLPPGEYTLRVLVRNFQSEAAALRELSLTVPDFSAFESAPITLFPGPRNRDPWMPVREWRTEGPMTEATYPFIADGESLSPATRPILVAGRRVEAFLFLPTLAPTIATSGRVELVRGSTAAASTVVAATDLDSLEPCSGRQSGPGCWRIQFTTPQAEPGSYRLRTVLTDAPADDTAGVTTSPGSPIMLLGGQVRERDLLWTDLRWLLSGEEEEKADRAAAARVVDGTPQAKPAAEPSKRAERRRQRKLAEKYRLALAELRADSPAGARSAILDLESQVLQQSSRGTVGSLQAAEMAVVEELAGRDVESLLPVLMLHDALYRTYRQRNLFSLVSHSRAMIEQIATTYAERGGTEGSRITAARALSSLAGYLQEANLPASSRRLFRLSLTFDPRNEAALVGLAASHEKYGDYLEAAYYLESLVEFSPSYGEGLLRLAVNLQRMGDKGRANELLQQATSDRSPTWVRILARQEAARGMIESGQLEDAASILEQAAELAPRQNSTQVLLAYVYDRLGRNRQASKATENLTSTTAASARRTYDTWPSQPLEQSRQELDHAAQARADSLRNALGDAKGNSP